MPAETVHRCPAAARPALISLSLNGRFDVFGLHLRTCAHVGTRQGAVGDHVNVAHDAAGSLMDELHGVLGEQRGCIPAVADAPLDVGERLL